uniref:Uncharacterized protein n=1 Tax=Bionectria ochroleuca TaxID=29856 RepID=A0A0B7JJ87_BIOOC
MTMLESSGLCQCLMGTYTHNASTRYGFIITNAHLVVLRLTRESIAPGATLGRPQRQQQQKVHGRHSSHNSDLSFMSSQFSAMSITHSSNDDATSKSVEYQPLGYAAKDWRAHGEGRLTIKLALFCLCLMAARGKSIQTSYPPLDSWRRDKNGYVHNTAGLFKDGISRGDNLFNPEPEPLPTPGSPASRSSSHRQPSTSGHDDTIQHSITVDYSNAPAPYGAPGYAPSGPGPSG